MGLQQGCLIWIIFFINILSIFINILLILFYIYLLCVFIILQLCESMIIIFWNDKIDLNQIFIK